MSGHDRILETPRLRLRPITLDDSQHFARLLERDSEAISRTASLPDPCTEAAARRWIGERMDQGHLFGILETATGAFVGAIGVVSLERTAAIGYWLGRAVWNRGLATEAVRAVVELAVARGAKVVEAETFPDNAASARVLEKVGFECTGTRVASLPERGGEREVRIHRYAPVG